MADNGLDDGWIWYWGQEMTKERKKCPECGSENVSYDADREIWTCSVCGEEWTENR